MRRQIIRGRSMNFGVSMWLRGFLGRMSVGATNLGGVRLSRHGLFAVFLAPLLVSAWVLSGFCEPPADMSPYAGPSGKARVAPVTVGGLKVTAVVADTHTGKVKGFLGWERVAEDEGMLLDFGIESSYSIHMQGMKFPIDAIWADNRGVVNAVYHDIKPNSGLIYPALSPSRYCLEIKAGMAKKTGVKIGDKLEFGMPTVIGK